MTDNQKEREAFEAWLPTQYWSSKDPENGAYNRLCTQGAWEAWQARAAIDAALAARGAVPAGWPRYTSEMGAAADKYINKLGGRSSTLPAQFRWEECLVAMLAAAPQQVAQPTTCKHCGGLGYTEKGGYQLPCICQMSADDLAQTINEMFAVAQPKPEQAAQQTQAAIDVLDERQRQISAEGWTLEHDDEHDTGEMAAAAACYTLLACAPIAENDFWRGMRGDAANSAWPWDHEWLKPGEPRRMLVKAGALILAEIERLDRRPQGLCSNPECGWRGALADTVKKDGKYFCPYNGFDAVHGIAAPQPKD